MDILLIGYKLSWRPCEYSGKDIDDTIRDAVAQTDINVTALYEDTSLDKVYDFNPSDAHQKIKNITEHTNTKRNRHRKYWI